MAAVRDYVQPLVDDSGRIGVLAAWAWDETAFLQPAVSLTRGPFRKPTALSYAAY